MSHQTVSKHILLALPFALALAPPGVTAPPVKGDVALLNLLRSVQSTNQTLLKRGELTAVVQTTRHGKNSSSVVNIEAKLVWEGDKTYWNYKLLDEDRAGSGEKSLEQKAGQMIEIGNGRLLMCFWPGAQLAQRISDKSVSYRDQLRLRPDQIWFSLEGLGSWEEFLDPAQAPKVTTEFHVTKSGADRIVVQRRYSNGAIHRVIASLRQGGNIVEYDSVGVKASHAVLRRGSYEWKEHPSGKWYLTNYDYEQTYRGDPPSSGFKYSLHITDIDPDPSISADRFQFSSFHLPRGTLVEEIGVKRRSYRLGDARSEVTQEVLDRLSEKLRADGFASKRNE